MTAFSDTFSIYFYKHFPQWRGRIPVLQQEALKSLAQDITNRQECRSVWECLEENPFLLSCYSQQVHQLLQPPKKFHPELMIFLWIICILLCLLIVFFFKQSINQEMLSIISIILGIFGACLKNSCQVYFSSIQKGTASSGEA